MPLSISSQAIIEKNKLTSTGVWIICLEIVYERGNPEEEHIYICSNNESVTWNSQTWLPFPFILGDIEESKDGDMPKTSLTISDVTRIITPILEDLGGGVGAEAIVNVVNTNYLAGTDAETTEAFEIIDVSIDSKNNIKFGLGVENLMNHRTPQGRYLKNHCRYKEFKGPQCGYSGAETTCDRTFLTCKNTMANQANFGGFPGVGQLGMQL